MNNYSLKVKNTTNLIGTSQYIVSILENIGVDTIFGYPGAPILALYNALIDSKIKHVLCRHEQGAVMAAAGYARVKERPATVLVTSGPGFSNTITGIMSSYADGVPLVVISGQVENIHQNEFQDADIKNISKTFTKKQYEITKPEQVEKVLKLAYNEANKIPKAPVIITVTKSVLQGNIENCERFNLKKEIKVEAPHSCVLNAIDLLKKAKRPLIIAGGGCKYCKSELIEFATLTHIPVVSTLMAKGISDEVSLGFIGLSGNRELSAKVEESDVVLALGTRFSNRTTINKAEFLPNSKIINININKNNSSNVAPHKEIIGDLTIVLQQMIGVIKSKNILFDIHFDWIEELSSFVEKFKNEGNKLTKELAIEEIYKFTKKYNPIITTDVGEHQILTAKIFKSSKSGKFITSGGFGAMGFGLPAAIGSYLAKPNSLILNISGDGSFQMNMQELGTCAEYNIPIKIVIINNSSLGMIKTLQSKKFGVEYQSKMLNPDFKELAKSYGILGYKIKTKEDLKSALKEIILYKKPVVLDIMVSD